MKKRIAAIIGCVALLPLAACGTSSAGNNAKSGDTGTINILAPAGVGGGWDLTSRALARVLESGGLDRKAVVENEPGAGGSIGLARFIASAKDPNHLMVMGKVMISALAMNGSQYTLNDVTPLARLTSEYEVVVVNKDSPFKTITDFVDALKENPSGVSFGGGSAGGLEQVLLASIAHTADVPADKLNYVAHTSGGDLTAAAISGSVKIAASSVSELAPLIESGKLRALAVSSPKRIEGIDAPTLIESGIDVEIANWRGIVGPKNLSREDRVTTIALLDKLAKSEAWKKELEANGWGDFYLSGDEFTSFVAEEEEQVRGALRSVGLIE